MTGADIVTNKEKYQAFCGKTYVPIYSQPWWMDAVCGPENWDVWLYESGGNVLAAMPCYHETRGSFHYITKAPLTQNNGIIFKEAPGRKLVSEAALQEKIINAACAHINSLGVDVYEQQYQPSFQNWQPFFWNSCTNVLRYTYIIENTADWQQVEGNISSTYRNKIHKGQRLTRAEAWEDRDAFYTEHERVFLRQGKQCPFSRELWNRLYDACAAHYAGQMFRALDEAGNLHALLFLVWDQRYVYQLLGGYMPEFASSQAYPALIYHGLRFAHEKGLAYDFEGSMIHQIAIAFRQFGGVPTPYYRIRKVFNPEIVRKEAEDYIRRLREESNSYSFSGQMPPPRTHFKRSLSSRGLRKEAA